MKAELDLDRDWTGAAIGGLRIAVAIYFFAAATGVTTMLSGIAGHAAALPHSLEAVIFAAGACVAAVWTIFGRLLTTSAVILAVYSLWASLLHIGAPADPVAALTVLMRDMALVGALMLFSRASGLAPMKTPRLREGATPPALFQSTPARPILAARPPKPLVEEDALDEDNDGLDRAVNALAMRRSAQAMRRSA